MSGAVSKFSICTISSGAENFLIYLCTYLNKLIFPGGHIWEPICMKINVPRLQQRLQIELTPTGLMSFEVVGDERG